MSQQAHVSAYILMEVGFGLESQSVVDVGNTSDKNGTALCPR